MDVTVEIVIDRPCAQVAAYAGDLDNLGTWYENVESVSWTTPPPVAAGSRADVVMTVMGRRGTHPHEVLQVVPGELLRLKMLDGGSMAMETTYTWTTVDEGRTRMTIRSHAEPSGMARIGAPMMSAGIKRNGERDLATLKRILEST